MNAPLFWDREMDVEMLHKAIVGRWLAAFWGERPDLRIVDELASTDVVLQYAAEGGLCGRNALKTFMTGLREAIPDLRFKRTGPMLSDRGMVVYRWQCSGIHTGPAYEDFQIGPLEPASGRRVDLGGYAAVKLKGELIVEEALWSTQRQAQMRVIDGGLMI